jgi:hypothetical protein
VPVKIRAMVKEPEQLDHTLGDIGWAYDFAYGITSDFVHPRPVGMRAYVADPGAAASPRLQTAPQTCAGNRGGHSGPALEDDRRTSGAAPNARRSRW